MSEDLFRREAIEAQSSGAGQFGRPTGVLPPSWTRITGLLALFMTALFIFLFSVDFARKETVRGKLRPVSGEAKVYAQEAGTVRRIHVEEGMLVRAGDPLIEIESERYLSDGAGLSEEAVASLGIEMESLIERRAALE